MAFARFSLPVVWVIIASSSFPVAATAQPEAPDVKKSTREIELPMPWPIILPNSTGTTVVCVQAVPAGFQWRDKFDGKAVVRVAVVDLETRAVVATRDLPTGTLRFAAGLDELYVADNSSDTIRGMSLRDLSDVRTARMPADAEDLILVADKLLCSTDGAFRLDLPELTPSKKWARLNTGSLGPMDAVFPVEGGGWHLDGVFWDKSLTRPRLIYRSPLEKAPSRFRRGDGSLPPPPYQLWTVGAKHGLFMKLGVAVSTEYPIAVVVAGSKDRKPGEDVSVTLALFPIGEQTPIAEFIAGPIPNFYIKDVVGQRSNWDLDFDKVPKQGGQVVSRFALNYPLNIVGRRVIWGADGQLYFKDLDAALLAKVTGPFRFELEQTALQADLDYETVLKHRVIGGTAPITFFDDNNNRTGAVIVNRRGLVNQLMEEHEEDYTDNRQAYDSLQRLVQILQGKPLDGPVDGDLHELDRVKNQMAPFFERVLGRRPQGVAFTHRIRMSASDSSRGNGITRELSYYVLWEVPESSYKPQLIAQQQAQETAREQARQPAIRSQVEQSEAKENRRAAWQSRKEADDLRRRSGPLLATVGVFLGILATVIVALVVLLSTKPASVRDSRLIARGPVLALIGVVPLVIFLLAALLPSASPTSSQVVVEHLVVPGSLIFFGLLQYVGTAVTAMDKGHGLLGWLLLGLFGPLGLFIALLLPNEFIPTSEPVWQAAPSVGVESVESFPPSEAIDKLLARRHQARAHADSSSEPLLLMPAVVGPAPAPPRATMNPIFPAAREPDVSHPIAAGPIERKDGRPMPGAKRLGIGLVVVSSLTLGLLVWFIVGQMTRPGISYGAALLAGQLIASVVAGVKCHVRLSDATDVRKMAWLALILTLCSGVYIGVFFPDWLAILGIWVLAQIPVVVFLKRSHSPPDME